MRSFFTLITLTALSLGGFWVYQNTPSVRHLFHSTLPLYTLEIQYPVEKIMGEHKPELIKNGAYTFLEPKLVYAPYLLLDVKYCRDRGYSEEGKLFWSLVDGEMVTNATTWEKTHGFEDCLLAKATETDFKILRLLSAAGGACGREKILERLNDGSDGYEKWIEHCLKRKLIVHRGDGFRLHFANPKLEFYPETKLKATIVSRPWKEAVLERKKYSEGQVKKLVQNAFGSDLYIRTACEVYLPIYLLSVQNPDGSTHTTAWNALTGKPSLDVSSTLSIIAIQPTMPATSLRAENSFLPRGVHSNATRPRGDS